METAVGHCCQGAPPPVRNGNGTLWSVPLHFRNAKLGMFSGVVLQKHYFDMAVQIRFHPIKIIVNIFIKNAGGAGWPPYAIGVPCVRPLRAARAVPINFVF